MNELISIILPVYNTAPYLEKTLGALKRQTYQNIEVLCIDDGSTDDSLAILRRFAQHDARFRVFTQENSGPARARNVGLENMRGKYLMFCDSDDWYEDNMCEVMVETMEKENVDLVMCDAFVHVESGNEACAADKSQYVHLPIVGRYRLDDAQKYDVNSLLWDKLFRAFLVKRYGIAFPNRYEHDDRSFVHQYLAVVNDGFFLSVPLYHHCARMGSIMENFYRGASPKKRLDCVHADIHTARFLRKHHLAQTNGAWFLKSVYASLVWHWKFFSQEQKLQALSFIRDILQTLNIETTAHPVLRAIQRNRLQRVRFCLDALHIARPFADRLFPRGSRRRRWARKFL